MVKTRTGKGFRAHQLVEPINNTQQHTWSRKTTMSSQQSIKQFFAGKTFEIPKYQRSYAWEKQNAAELYQDVQEAIEVRSTHYIGTVVLAKTADPNVFHIVDGQQRMTTLILFISALVEAIADRDEKMFYRRSYVKQRDRYKLTPLARDSEFYFALLDGNTSLTPQSKSQRNMLEVHDEIRNLVEQSIDDPLRFLEAIESLFVLEFIEEKEADAIRIFQTVNDRGRELSKMDKMKSLLFYYSNKYLAGRYDERINDTFGEIFERYDDIKLTAEQQRINIINSRQFNEDDLLRQHHVCFSDVSFDPTALQVLDDVKQQLQALRGSDGPELEAYLQAYLDSLLAYVRCFSAVVRRTRTDADYYKLFSILGLAAVYYPAITQLEHRGFLDQALPGRGISVLKMVEIIDVRVLKVREYAGKKHIADFAFRLNNENLDMAGVEQHLTWFNAHEISDERFMDYLSTYSYFKQTGLLRTLFIDYCERLKGKRYTLDELERIMDNDPTIEHVLSQDPQFRPRAFGFRSTEDFEEHMGLIGNLTLLEKRINSSIKNSGIPEKVAGYRKSQFRMTSKLATALDIDKTFTKSDLLSRGNELIEDFAKRWSA